MWTLELTWTVWRTQKYLPLLEIEPRLLHRPTHSLITTTTELIASSSVQWTSRYSLRHIRVQIMQCTFRTKLQLEHLCGLVFGVPGYRYRDPRFDSRHYQIFWEVVSLEQDPLSLVRITEELPEWKRNSSGTRKSRLRAVGIRWADHAIPSIRKSWH
jgi:hypothetical protein